MRAVGVPLALHDWLAADHKLRLWATMSIPLSPESFHPPVVTSILLGERLDEVLERVAREIVDPRSPTTLDPEGRDLIPYRGRVPGGKH